MSHSGVQGRPKNGNNCIWSFCHS